MGFSRFYNRGMFMIKETSSDLQLGFFRLAEATELKYIQLTFYKKGAHGSTDKFRLKLYSTSGYAGLITQSSYLTLSTDISGITSSNWYGWVRMDFDRHHIMADTNYWMAIESANYTRNANTYYWGFKTDWPDTKAGSFVSPQISVIGYRST